MRSPRLLGTIYLMKPFYRNTLIVVLMMMLSLFIISGDIIRPLMFISVILIFEFTLSYLHVLNMEKWMRSEMRQRNGGSFNEPMSLVLEDYAKWRQLLLVFHIIRLITFVILFILSLLEVM